MKPAAFVAAASLALVAPLAAQSQAPSGIDTTNFDRSVRPQDDFFRFANGNWLRHTRIPADRSSYGSFVELDDAARLALREIVEELAKGGHRDGTAEQKVGDFYASFMDSTAVEKAGLEPLREELELIANYRERSDLPGLLAHLARLRVTTPIGFSVGVDQKDATRYVAYASQSGLGMPDRSYYLDAAPELAKTRDAYRWYVEELLRLGGAPDPRTGAEQVLAFETELAKLHWERARTRDREATYNAFEPTAILDLTPSFSWARFLAALDARETPILVVRQPDYFRALDALIDETPAEVWRLYLTARLLDAHADYLGSDFVRASFEFRGRTLQGQAALQPRWMRGIAAIQGTLGMELGRLYAGRHFRPEAKERMNTLVTHLLSTFRDGIEQLEWMTPATRAQAQEKLARFTVKIGHPDIWPPHVGLMVRRGELLDNVRRLRRFTFDEMVADLGAPVDETRWTMTPQTVNAYYNPTLNEIVFPAAILQPPFFDPAADDAVNYGAIGAVIGHEISHGFDDQGSRSDGDGNLRDWWAPEDAAAFKARTDRLATQYDAYEPLEGVHVDGRLTLGENIGDLSGVAVAYAAYRRSLEGREPPVIDGLTGDQRFFLGWAQVWRTLYRDEALRQRLLTDPHSPGEYRVNGVMRNLEAFHRAWGVKRGDGMWSEPEERITIW